MSLISRLDQDYIAAYKAKDELRVAVLRMLKTAIKNKSVELLREPADAEVLDLIARQIKQRRESVDQFEKGGRPELAEREAREAEVLQEYLPQALTREELTAAIDEIVTRLGLSGPKDMGRAMAALAEAHKGRYDGKEASSLVRDRLSS